VSKIPLWQRLPDWGATAVGAVAFFAVFGTTKSVGAAFVVGGAAFLVVVGYVFVAERSAESDPAAREYVDRLALALATPFLVGLVVAGAAFVAGAPRESVAVSGVIGWLLGLVLALVIFQRGDTRAEKRRAAERRIAELEAEVSRLSHKTEADEPKR